MREYEFTFVVQPEINEEGLESIRQRFESTLEQQGATKLFYEDWGRRRLAYEIQNFQKGHYLVLHYLDEGRAIPEMERVGRLDDSVMRFLTVLANEEVEDIEARKAQAVELEEERVRKAAERVEREAEEAAARAAEAESRAAEAESRAAMAASAAESVSADPEDGADDDGEQGSAVQDASPDSAPETDGEAEPDKEPAVAEATPEAAAAADGEAEPAEEPAATEEAPEAAAEAATAEATEEQPS